MDQDVKLLVKEEGTRERCIAVPGLMVLFVEETNTLGHWTRKVIEYFKQGLLGHPTRSSEAVLRARWAQLKRFQRRILVKWPRDHSCDILIMNMAAFCLY